MTNEIETLWKLVEEIDLTIDYFVVEFPEEQFPQVWNDPISHFSGGVSPNDLLKIKALLERVDRYEKMLMGRGDVYMLCHEAYEIYAGMEGFIPETAPEGYALQIINELGEAIGKAKQAARSSTPDTIVVKREDVIDPKQILWDHPNLTTKGVLSLFEEKDWKVIKAASLLAEEE